MMAKCLKKKVKKKEQPSSSRGPLRWGYACASDAIEPRYSTNFFFSFGKKAVVNWKREWWRGMVSARFLPSPPLLLFLPLSDADGRLLVRKTSTVFRLLFDFSFFKTISLPSPTGGAKRNWIALNATKREAVQHLFFPKKKKQKNASSFSWLSRQLQLHLSIYRYPFRVRSGSCRIYRHTRIRKKKDPSAGKKRNYSPFPTLVAHFFFLLLSFIYLSLYSYLHIYSLA